MVKKEDILIGLIGLVLIIMMIVILTSVNTYVDKCNAHWLEMCPCLLKEQSINFTEGFKLDIPFIKDEVEENELPTVPG